MTANQRHHFSPLIELLSSWHPREQAALPDLAGSLADWIGAMDALQLDAALKSLAPSEPEAANRWQLGRPGSGLHRHHEVAKRLASRVEAVQQDLIAAKAQIAPVAPTGVADDAASGLASWGRGYAARQVQMESRVRALRAELQRMLAQLSAWGRQLATLDAAMADVLGARYQRLWLSLPRWLELRVEQLPSQAQQDTAALWTAEVAERLRPAWSLVAAVRADAAAQGVRT